MLKVELPLGNWLRSKDMTRYVLLKRVGITNLQFVGVQALHVVVVTVFGHLAKLCGSRNRYARAGKIRGREGEKKKKF